MIAHAEKRQRLAEQLRAASGGAVGLAKETTNLFRSRQESGKQRLDVRTFNQVLAVNAGERWVDVEGMTPYADLVDATLPRGVMPAVVPQLKSITIGGAVSGVGIESSSFRYGLVHESIREMDVLLADGAVVTCTPANEHRDLFHGIPNSYGTLGYILRLRALVVPVKPFVRIEHVFEADPERYFARLGESCLRDDVDFVDGVVFAPGEHYLTLGRFVDSAPWTSDYTWLNIYYRSVRDRDTDYLTVRDYLWRWDTDWFWCSKHLGAQNPLIRRLFGRRRLNSITYMKIMRWNRRHGWTDRLDRLRGMHSESVIQDVDIPLDRCAAFLDFFHREIGIRPVWICPIRARDPGVRFPLYPLRTDTTCVNFGFWDVVSTRESLPRGHYNRLIERRVSELGGLKSLYSDSYFTEEEFWSCYDRDAYTALKQRYDPAGRLLDLYRKCVLRS